jgi:hypothetical protein
VRRRQPQDVVRVRVPNDQAPVFHVPGPHGGWFASLLYGFGTSVDVPMRNLRKLLAGSRGEVIIARRLTRAEQELLERERGDSDAGVHARIVVKEEERFHRPRRGGGAPDHRGEHRNHAGSGSQPRL